MQYYGIRRKAASTIPERAGENGVAPGAEAALAAAAASSGSPLPAPLQRKFEGSLGADLSAVRVHTGAASAAAAASVSAHAYTTGNDVHFNQGHYNPDSTEGQRLLAHEVAHTVQQKGAAPATQAKLEVSSPGDAQEAEADVAAEAMVRGEAARVGGAAPATTARVHRFVDPNNPVFKQKDQDYKAAAASKDWPGAATALNGLAKDDILEEIKDLKVDDLKALQKAALSVNAELSQIIVDKYRNDVANKAAQPGQHIQDQSDIDQIKEKAPTYSTCTTYSAQVAGRAQVSVKGPNAYVEVNPNTTFKNANGEKLSAKRDLPPGSWQDGTPGMSNRPKAGDMLVLMSRNRVTFLHIDILRKIDAAQQGDGDKSKGETWTTVDGGGTTSTLDQSVFDQDKAELRFIAGGHRGTMALRGWFDVAQLAGFDSQPGSQGSSALPPNNGP